MKISVIVPIYNIENYLDDCIISILNQSYYNFELILVDDGSTDHSAEICEKYRVEDQRIKVIHQNNQGLSAARNTGIHSADGQYLYFVDGDDYIHHETLSSFMDVLEQSPDLDFIIGRMSYFTDGSEIMKVDIFNVNNDLLFHKSGQSAFVSIMENQKRFRMGVRGLYKRQFILEKMLFFDLNNNSEDVDWTVRLFRYAKNVGSNNKPYYYYREKRPGSITNTLKVKNAKDVIKVLKNWETLVAHQDIEPKFRRILMKECGRRYFNMFKKFSALLSENEKRDFYQAIHESKSLLRYVSFPLSIVLILSFNLLGIEKTSNALCNINNIRRLKRLQSIK